jgi:hypothetical protein
MRAKVFSHRKIHLATVALLFISTVFYGLPARAANPACSPTTSTLGNLTVLEFVNPNTNESNTTDSNIGYTCDWTVPTGVYAVSVVIVGGGGSGGYGNQAGGGGGGEVVYTATETFTSPSSIKTITVGTGGAAPTAPANVPGNTGANSSYDGVIAHGGGGGGSAGPYSTSAEKAGLTGGSSGGGSRFGNLVVAPTRTTAPGFTSLANSGGNGAGKSTNDPASATQCAPFGSGGGGGGAMSVGGNALATCTDSSTAGSVNITVGAGGAGAYLLGKCVGGGGASLAGTGAPPVNPTNGGYNFGTITVNQATKTPCKDPTNNNQDVAGTWSGGGSGVDFSNGAPNTGGGSSGAPTDYGRPRGGSGVVLIAYDATNPPVRPGISTQPQTRSILSLNTETLTVAASVNDGGTLSYLWQSSPSGSSTWTNIANSDSSTYVTPPIPATSSGVKYRVQITNTKSTRTSVTISNAATLTVNRRTTTISLSYGDTSTVRYFDGETFTATFSSNSDVASSRTFSSLSSTICSIDASTGLITALRPGQCSVQVSIPSSDRCASATLSLSFVIRNKLQVVTWSSLPSLPVSSAAVQLGVTPGYALATGETATGSGTISYSVVNACSSFSITSDGRITPLALGACRIRALQAATSTFDPGSAFETLTVVATPPDAPFINTVSSSGGSGSTSGAITVSLTSGNENGASITHFVVTAAPSVGSAIQETLTASAGTRTVTVTGLTLGTAYTVKAKVINSAGSSSDRTYGSTVTPAGVPYGVSALTDTPGDTTLTINYTAPASLNGGTWDRYQYFISPTGTPFSDTPTAISVTQANTSYTFTGLTNGAAYAVKVVALTSANGTASSANTTLLNLVPAVAPQAPTISITRIDSATARINWYTTGSGGSPVTSYTVAVNKNSVSQSCYVNVSTTNCTISGLSTNDVLTASATATNLVGTSASSATATYTHATAPLSPTGITTTSGDTYISISFTQPSSGDAISDYEYSYDGATFTSVGVTSSPITLTGLTNETTYSLVIRAIGFNYGAGLLSETITATAGIPAPPPPPPSNGGGGGFSYTPPVVVETTTVLAVDTSTVIIVVETSTTKSETSTPEVRIPVTETNTVVVKISIRMQEPFRVNSYFVNVVATNELSAIVKKYSKSKVLRVITIGYSSPSLVNPYPSRLGTWRAEAIAKTMKKLGLKTSYTAKYGGLFTGSRKDARKVRIILYIETIKVTTT